MIVIWIAEGVWEAAVDAATTLGCMDDEVTLVHVSSDEPEQLLQGAFAGLMGRRRAPVAVDPVVGTSADDLLAAAAARLGRPAVHVSRQGRVEREVVAAAEGAELLVVSRDGDQSRLGPHSLGRATRFVVDHAPCPVLLVWPSVTPAVSSIPPPPPEPGHEPPRPPQH